MFWILLSIVETTTKNYNNNPPSTTNKHKLYIKSTTKQ